MKCLLRTRCGCTKLISIPDEDTHLFIAIPLMPNRTFIPPNGPIDYKVEDRHFEYQRTRNGILEYEEMDSLNVGRVHRSFPILPPPVNPMLRTIIFEDEVVFKGSKYNRDENSYCPYQGRVRFTDPGTMHSLKSIIEFLHTDFGLPVKIESDIGKDYDRWYVEYGNDH